MLHTKIIDIKDKKLSIVEAENFISSTDFGASIFFSGTVRNQNNNKSVTGITYDSHDTLVIKSFEEIYNEVDQKLNIKDEIGKSLQNLNALNKNFQTYAKNNPDLFKTAGVSTQQTFTKVDNVKGLVPFMKSLGIKCQLSEGINCMNPKAYEKSLNQISKAAKAGDSAAQSKLLNFRNAVKGAGGGDRAKGAAKMYRMMNQFERMA